MEITKNMQREADSELARHSLISNLSYFVAWTLLAFGTNILQRDQVIACITLLLMFIVAGLRIWQARQLNTNYFADPQRWRRQFGVGVVAMSSILNEQLSGHVLVAEDTPELQLLERRILESIGLTVTTAADGQEAIDRINQNHIDLVLMDMQMPNVDGIEATRRLRQQGHTLPIIALTANVMQKHRDAFHAAGCDGFLGKPIDKSELRKILKQHLSKGQERLQIPASAVEEVDEELMQVFVESNAQRLAALREGLAGRDWQQVRVVAHAIKGSAASFGFPQLAIMAEQLQRSIDQEQMDELAGMTMDLVIELGKLVP